MSDIDQVWKDSAVEEINALRSENKRQATTIATLRKALEDEREECAKILDAAALDWNRIRDPGMANNARCYAAKIRARAAYQGNSTEKENP